MTVHFHPGGDLLNPLISINQQTFYYQVQVPAGTASPDTPSAIPDKTVLSENENPKSGQSSQKTPGRRNFDTYECQTCKNRKYQDGSNDPGVSFKTPTAISPERAAFAIRSHEAEHVAHARLKALEEDKEIVSQSVSYRTGICPECGKTFMAGGNTRTVLRTAPETYQQEPVKKGVYLDLTA